jgi:hypothetical protein
MRPCWDAASSNGNEYGCALRGRRYVEQKLRDRAIIEALYGTGAHVDELVQGVNPTFVSPAAI